jgi:hypothetical protein
MLNATVSPTTVDLCFLFLVCFFFFFFCLFCFAKGLTKCKLGGI